MTTHQEGSNLRCRQPSPRKRKTVGRYQADAPGRETAMDKLREKRLQREAARLIKSGKMPSLDELCAAVLDARKKYANQIRRARREQAKHGQTELSLPWSALTPTTRTRRCSSLIAACAAKSASVRDSATRVVLRLGIRMRIVSRKLSRNSTSRNQRSKRRSGQGGSRQIAARRIASRSA